MAGSHELGAAELAMGVVVWVGRLDLFSGAHRVEKIPPDGGNKLRL
jgi:hypothetical protein